MDSKKENRMAASRSIPRGKSRGDGAPERENTRRMATACAMPDQCVQPPDLREKP